MDRFKRDLILLNMLEGVGYIRIKTLLDVFKTTQAIFEASCEELMQVEGIGSKIADFIKRAGIDWDIDKELSLIEKNGITVKTIFDQDYPENLRQTYDPPAVLYVKGKLKPEDNQAIAIVGSRRCTQYGIRTAQRLASGLPECGITVVSGMARGIDTAAHKGAISANGRTIAVLGNGLSFVYPHENKRLADKIVENGALVSEFPMEMPPHKENFPRRNRVISGLSKGVVVVEAAERSGALITADFALSEGRDVFAVPGPAGAVTSKGTNNLIREGAKITEDVNDILAELGRFRENIKGGEGLILNDPCENSIYNLVSDKPIDIDAITDSLSLEPSKAKTTLLNLEIKGIVKQLPGKLYVRAK